MMVKFCLMHTQHTARMDINKIEKKETALMPTRLMR